MTTAVRELVGEDGREALDLMVKVMRGQKIGRRSPTIRDRMEAAQWLIDRGFGKAMQVSEVAVKRTTYFVRAEDLPPEEET